MAQLVTGLSAYSHVYACITVQPPGMRLAKLHRDAVFTTPCETSILYPLAGGNMHRFTAVTSCAVLDVLGPPYSDAEGRPCMYYNDFPYASFSGMLHYIIHLSQSFSNVLLKMLVLFTYAIKS